VQYSTVRTTEPLQYSTVQYNTLLYSKVQNSTVPSGVEDGPEEVQEVEEEAP